MIVRIGESSLEVAEADDLSRLSVVTTAGAARAEAVLRRSGLGVLDGPGEARLDLGELHRLASAGARRPDWEAGWAEMLRYATAHGWVSPDGRTVAAHLEPPT